MRKSRGEREIEKEREEGRERRVKSLKGNLLSVCVCVLPDT